MRRHLFSILAIPMVFLAQCAPQCAPAPGPGAGDLRQNTVISIGPVETYGYGGHVGADWLDAAGNKICQDRNCGYWALRHFQMNGTVDGGGIPVGPAGVEMGRIEFYPDGVFGDWGSNDAWNTTIPGGLHIWNPDGRALNGMTLPFGPNGAFHYVGSARNGPRGVEDGRLQVYAFQLINKDGTPGAFNISTSRNSQWTAGYIWAGTYILELRDTATGRAVTGCPNLAPGVDVTIDISQPRFGLPACPF
jgi:hypothetical protein